MRINEAFTGLTNCPEHQAVLRKILRHRKDKLNIENSILELHANKDEVIKVLGVDPALLHFIFKIPSVAEAIRVADACAKSRAVIRRSIWRAQVHLLLGLLGLTMVALVLGWIGRFAVFMSNSV